MTLVLQILAKLGNALWKLYSHDWGTEVVVALTLGLLVYSGQRAIKAFRNRGREFSFPDERIKFEAKNRSELRKALFGIACSLLMSGSFGFAILSADEATVWFYFFVYGVVGFGIAGVISSIVLYCTESQ